MKDHRQREYQKYIYPAIYQEPYPDEEVQLDITDIQDFDFIATNIPYNIQVPILTDREVSHLNHILDNESAEKELVSSGILDQAVIHLYKKYYKFLPSFHDVRI